MKKYENFVSALVNLEDAPNQDLNNDFVQSGLINKFNLQFELSWKLLKRLLEYEGATLAASGFPRAILKESYRFYDFIDEAAWLDMLRDRNTNVHIYDNKLAQDLIQRILNVYIPAFSQLRDGLMERYGELLLAPDDQFV
ncbi:Nucleotidyltransferase substrate binding protein like protein [Collinsella aerofaciens]|nr:Nucleotidyltransferase substrate binding protein like protein [Collinsella aerofaciens]